MVCGTEKKKSEQRETENNQTDTQTFKAAMAKLHNSMASLARGSVPDTTLLGRTAGAGAYMGAGAGATRTGAGAGAATTGAGAGAGT